MLARSSSLRFLDSLHKLVFFISSSSTISSIVDSSLIEADRLQSDKIDFEAKVLRLRDNKLNGDSLIRVLQGTPDITLALRIFQWASQQTRFNQNVHTYYWMILKLGISGHLNEMDSCCLNMLRDKCHGAEKVLVTLIDTLVRQESFEAAKRVLIIYLNSSKTSIDTFNLLLRAYAAKKCFSGPVFVYKEMVKRKVAPNAEALNYFIEILFATGKVDSALATYRRMRSMGCIPNIRTFEIVLEGLLAEGDAIDDDVLISIFNEMLTMGLKPEMEFYKRVVSSCCDVNSVGFGFHLFKMMEDYCIPSDPLVLEPMVRLFCKNSIFEEAMKLLYYMAGFESTPSTSLLVDVAEDFCRAGNQRQILKFLTEISYDGASPYNIVISSLCQVDDAFSAISLLSHMSAMKIADRDTWNILIGWFLKTKDPKKAYSLLANMITSSFPPNATTYSTLIVGFCSANNHDRALKLFHKLRSENWFLDSESHSEIIKSLCSTKRYAEALQVFRYMLTSDTAIEPGTFKSLMRALFELGSEANLLQFASRFVISGHDFDSESYAILLRSMVATNRVRVSAIVLNKMIDEGVVPDDEALNSVLLFMRDRSALRMILRSVEKLVVGDALDWAMYNVVVGGFWDEGDEESSRRFLDVMLERGWVPDDTTHKRMLGLGNFEEENNLIADKRCILSEVDSIFLEALLNTS